MKILVTGGAGYLGSVMVPELLKGGHAVTVIDNFMYNQPSLLDCCHDRRFEIVRGDVRDKKLLSSHITKADAIFPLACLTGAPICDKFPSEAEGVNLGAVKLILEMRNKRQKIIFPTTNSGYGLGEKGIFCTERTPLKPISLYGRLKVKAEEMILKSGNSITLRLATAFGISPRMRLDLLVNDFTYRAVYDRYIVVFEGSAKRNYIHVRDVAKAFLHCLGHFDRMKGEPYNVGLSDANLSKIELCREIKKQVPSFYFTESRIGCDPDKRDYIVSNEKIEKTGYRPGFSIREGIAELIKGYSIVKRNQYANV